MPTLLFSHKSDLPGCQAEKSYRKIIQKNHTEKSYRKIIQKNIIQKKYRVVHYFSGGVANSSFRGGGKKYSPVGVGVANFKLFENLLKSQEMAKTDFMNVPSLTS
jgi:hypothetical protein